MPRQDIAGLALLEKVNARYIILFKEDELFLALNQGSQQWTDPCDEGHRSILKELNLLEGLLVNEIRHINPEILRQVLRKLDQLINIILVLLVQGLLDIFVELQW